MLKLLIVDDEQIIRDTISALIDWQALNLNLIGTCKNGIEAYETILDEYPDIILTDIKMPGLSGLELIEKAKKLDQNIQFIILSGYDDFNFAQTAMKFGVKHYLLKPCNELDIIEVMTQAIKDFQKSIYEKELIEEKENLSLQLHQTFSQLSKLEGIFNDTEILIQKLYETPSHENTLLLLKQFFISITDLEMNRSLCVNLVNKIATQYNSIEKVSLANFINEIYESGSISEIYEFTAKKLDTILQAPKSFKYAGFIDKILDYVDQNIEDPNLSLKNISENYLYMNVDYVSKQFSKQTGEKFSSYVLKKRIEKAKKLLLTSDCEKIYLIAEQVGCGNNPQYFSQIFKKYTGLTPSLFLKKHSS